MEFIHQFIRFFQNISPVEKSVFTKWCKNNCPTDMILDYILPNDAVPIDIRIIMYNHIKMPSGIRGMTFTSEQVSKLRSIGNIIQPKEKVFLKEKIAKRKREMDTYLTNVKKRKTIKIPIDKRNIATIDSDIWKYIFSYLDLIYVRSIRRVSKVLYLAYLSSPFPIIVPSKVDNIFHTGMHLALYTLEMMPKDTQIYNMCISLQYSIITARNSSTIGGSLGKRTSTSLSFFDKLVDHYSSRIVIYHLNRYPEFPILDSYRIEYVTFPIWIQLSESLRKVPSKLIFNVTGGKNNELCSLYKLAPTQYPNIEEIILFNRNKTIPIFNATERILPILPNVRSIRGYGCKAEDSPHSQAPSGIKYSISSVDILEDQFL